MGARAEATTQVSWKVRRILSDSGDISKGDRKLPDVLSVIQEDTNITIFRKVVLKGRKRSFTNPAL
jgi:hypothetical protein